MRKETQPNIFPQLSFLSRPDFTHKSLSPPCQECRATGNGGCSQFITHCLPCSFVLKGRTSHTLTLFQHGVTPTGDSSLQTSQTQVLPTAYDSPQIAPALVSSTGFSPSGTGCSRSQIQPASHLQRVFLSPWLHRSHRSLLQCRVILLGASIYSSM